MSVQMSEPALISELPTNFPAILIGVTKKKSLASKTPPRLTGTKSKFSIKIEQSKTAYICSGDLDGLQC